MVEKRELILFVPGMGGTERERYLSLLVGGIGHFFRMRAMPYEVAIEPGDAAVGRHRFRLAGPDGTRTIDVREAFWGDLRMPLSGEPQFAKIVRGFGLLGYWALAPRIWSMFAKSAFMAINMIVTTMLLLAWYWGAVASFLVAFGDVADRLQALANDADRMHAETVAAEMAARILARRNDDELQLVLADARELHVAAVVRAVACDHRHELSLELLAAVDLRQLVADVQIGHPLALGEAVGVVGGGMDVGLEMDVGIGGRPHHPRRVPGDGLGINGGDLHPVPDLGLAAWIFLRPCV